MEMAKLDEPKVNPKKKKRLKHYYCGYTSAEPGWKPPQEILDLLETLSPTPHSDDNDKTSTSTLPLPSINRNTSAKMKPTVSKSQPESLLNPPIPVRSKSFRMNKENTIDEPEWDSEDLREIREMCRGAKQEKFRSFLFSVLLKHDFPLTDAYIAPPEDTPRSVELKVVRPKVEDTRSPEQKKHENFVRATSAFQQYANGRDFITHQDFVPLMKELGLSMTEQMAKITITTLIDKNNDGVIQLNEFADWWNSFH